MRRVAMAVRRNRHAHGRRQRTQWRRQLLRHDARDDGSRLRSCSIGCRGRLAIRRVTPRRRPRVLRCPHRKRAARSLDAMSLLQAV
jgi:hypothetical protein